MALRRTDALLVAGAGTVGALPVLWVLGVVPWRLPSLLIQTMFSGFTACALDSGALTPLNMVCGNAGVPLGMYQLDGGLTYPLGGLLVRAGASPLAAWRGSVALVVVAGFAALFWLLRRLTRSSVAAAGLVALHGLSGGLTARSWNWYWNVTAVALLPLLFAVLHLLFARAGRRRPGLLVPPAVGCLAVTALISLEWQYAGLFAVAVCTGAVGVLLVQRGWSRSERLAIAGATVGALGVVAVLLRGRLATAGITSQFADTALTTAHRSVDLLALVAPDSHMSLTGALLDAVGADPVLAHAVVNGPQLWAAPYLGVLTLACVGVLAVRRRHRLAHGMRHPAGYLPLLGLVAIGALALSLGPRIRVSWLLLPTLHAASPLSWLWTATPLRWIRYPWTWVHLTNLALLLAWAALAPALLRGRDGRWSPLALVLAAVLALDLLSPQVVAAFDDAQPSVVTAPAWTRFDADDDGVATFEARAVPELVDALGGLDGPAVMLPWTNAWTVPRLGPADGVAVRNTGIDRNVAQAERMAPVSRYALRAPTMDTVRALVDSDWAAAVVLLDVMPRTGDDIVRRDHQHPRPADVGWEGFVRRAGTQFTREGYCVRRWSWFTTIRRCPPVDVPTRAGRTRAAAAPAGGR